MSKPKVGLQLIIYGRRAQQDLAAVLAEVATAGYDGIEGGAPISQDQVDRIRAALEQAGLLCAGGHTGFSDLKDADAVKARARGVKALGGQYLISSGGDWPDLDTFLRAGQHMNEIGRWCREEGVTFCYHNHHWEFKRFDGTVAYHAMMAATDPLLVKLCPDVYWIHVGGERPPEFISSYRDRCPYFHLKDGLGGDQYTEFRELGRGAVDLPAVLQAALSCQPEWIVVEQDSTKVEPAESNRISRDYLRGLGV